MTVADVPSLRVRGRVTTVTSTLTMGVVNASPNSFSDGGRYQSLDAQLKLAGSHISQGADIVDVGGQSAITGEAEVQAADELDRVRPIVSWIRAHHPDVLVSVDTYKPVVVEGVLQAGADIVNDVSGLLYPEVAAMCASFDRALVIMHTAAKPKMRLQEKDLYTDVVEDVRGFLGSKMASACALGLSREALILDPGPDFTKTPHQTVEILRNLSVIRSLGRPTLLAVSRKDFLGAILNRSPSGRNHATIAAIALLTAVPGNIVRVHDVAAAIDAIKTVDVLVGRRDIPADYLLPDQIRHEPRLGSDG